jgi:hypothetical protein
LKRCGVFTERWAPVRSLLSRILQINVWTIIVFATSSTSMGSEQAVNEGIPSSAKGPEEKASVDVDECDTIPPLRKSIHQMRNALQQKSRASSALRGPLLLSRGNYAFCRDTLIHEVRISRGALSREPILQGC